MAILSTCRPTIQTLPVELVALICSWLVQADQCTLALTCLAFTEAALDSIWHTLYNLEPLFALWPCDALSSPWVCAHPPPRNSDTVLLIRRPFKATTQ